MEQIDHTVLGKIILLQSTLHIQNDEGNLARFVCRGLSVIPGIRSVEMLLDGVLFSDQTESNIPVHEYDALKSFLAGEAIDKSSRENLVAQFKAKHEVDCLEIKTVFSHYGWIILRQSELARYLLYKPYVENTLNLVALVIENNRQKTELLHNQGKLERAVRLRTSKFAQTVVQLKWELSVNQALNRLSEALIDGGSSLEKVAAIVLQSAKELTRSEQGFVSVIDRTTGNNIGLTPTKMAASSLSSQSESQIKFLKGEDGLYPGLCGIALNSGKPFYNNEPHLHPLSKDIPSDHLPLKNFIASPALLADLPYGEIVLANSPNGFTEQDLSAVTQIAHLYALALHRKNFEDRLKSSLKEKETLLQEIHHRVKNNMQVVASLLKLQANKSRSKQVKEILGESQSRLYAMASIHESLYRSQNLNEISLQSYLNTITRMAFQSCHTDSGKVRLVMAVEDIRLGIEQASPLGLAVNELITNAFKHAFPSGREGVVTISASNKADKTVKMIVQDNGIGLPDHFDWRASDSLGLQLVTTLVEQQLDGSVRLEANQGSAFVIEFRINPY